MRVLPFLFVIFLLTSVLAVPVPSGDSSEEGSSLSLSEWRIEVVDSDDVLEGQTSIAIGSDGYPHICYMAKPTHDLMYAKWVGDHWEIETVTSTGPSGQSNSVALDGNDWPRISFHDWLFGGSLNYARWNGINWSIETVDSVGFVGRGNSLALDSNDDPHISYFDDTNQDLKYAKWTGVNWTLQTVDATGDYRSSIDLDSNDNPHISYRGSQNLKHARWNGTEWLVETVDTAYGTGRFSSIALDSHDNAHISYEDWVKDDLKYARWNGSAWEIETVDSTGEVGHHTSIALDSADYPHMTYRDYSNGDLKYAEWTGSGWNIESVDSEGQVGGLNSIALDEIDLPHVSYVDHWNYTLKYATKAELKPPEPEEKRVTLDIDPDTLNLKSRGRWISARLSAENASVYDIDVSTILLQDALAPERWDYQDDILMLKFNRQDLITILDVGESVEIKLNGKWKDGTAFEAYDYIRVINPGKK